MRRRLSSCSQLSTRFAALAASPAFYPALLGALAPLLASVSCSSAPPHLSQPRPSLLSAAPNAVGFKSPAEWHYHPSEHGRMLAKAAAGPGSTVYAGERGERWQVTRGVLRAAPRLAPEALISVLRQSDKHWLFVGASGTTYEADSPLGEFTRSTAPLEPLVEVSASGASLAGVRKDGSLVVSAFTSTQTGAWQLAKLKGGQPSDRFVGVQLLPSGRGYALSTPERLWQTRDNGKSWEPLAVKRFGAYRLEPDADAVIVRGVIGDRRLSGEALTQVTPRRAGAPVEITESPPRGPDAGALAEHRAVLMGERYLELTLTSGKVAEWELVSGRLGTPLVLRKTQIPRSCKTPKLAAFGQVLYAACTERPSGTSHQIAFYVSADLGKHWELLQASAEGRISQLKMAVGRAGTLLVSGLCPERSAKRGCRPEGLYYLGEKESDAGKSEEAFVPAATPSLKGNVLALGFSSDGRTAYAAGVRSKSSTFSVYTSTDAGRSFTPQEIEGLSMEAAPSETAWRGGYSPSSTFGVSSAGAAPDGSIGFVVERGSDTRVVVTDEAGRLLSMASVPSSGAAVGISGGRAVAVVPRTGEAWETQDAGGDWRNIGGIPASVCTSGAGCEASVGCSAAGCVIGAVLTRLGWGIDDTRDLPILTTPVDETRRELRIRTPLVCELATGAWYTLDGVTAAPEAENAAFRKAAWFAVAGDDDTGQVSYVQGQGGSRQRVERETLLAAAPNPAQVAVYYSTQLEGVAAMRYALPKGSASIKDIEVAWRNLQDDKLLRGSVADAGIYRPGDYVSIGGKRTQRAAPDLLSIASGGIFLRPHRLLRQDQTTFFLDGKTVDQLPPVYWPSIKLSNRAFNELVRVDGASLPLVIVGDGLALVAALSGGEFQAATLGLVEPLAFGVSVTRGLTYVDGRASLQLNYLDRAGRGGRTLLFPLSAGLDLPVVEAPSQAQLPNTPRRCDADQLSKTPRVVAPYAPGTRHPIIVNSPTEAPLLLMSESAVLHGSVSEPCMAALDAQVVASEAHDPTTRALILLDDLEHAWLFRREGSAAPPLSLGSLGAPLGTLPTGALQYRAMSCSFAPKAILPPEVYAQPGTRVSR